MSNEIAVAEQRSLVESIKHPKMQDQIRASLPPTVSLERFTAVTIAAINHNGDLLSADRQSFYNAVVKAAQDGLMPDGNEAVLNIYSTNVGTKDRPKWIQKVQYQKMVAGILKKFEEAGIDAWANSVYTNDTFDVWSDNDGQHLIHRPTKLGQPKGERIGAYAIAKRTGGRSSIIQVMDMEDLARVKAASKSPEKGPWKSWPERMEQKSVLHRLKKRVATIDPEAAEKLNRVDSEFEDELDDASPEAPKQEVPTQETKRPAVLQAVMDQHGTASAPEAEGAGDVHDGDPGPQEGDII